MGQTGMPDAFRITVEGFGAHPQHKARARASTARRRGQVRATLLAFSTVLPGEGAGAAGGREFPGFEAYLSVLPLLDRDDIAALALTLGILCFAVVSAILFVRTRRHLAEVEAAGGAGGAKAEPRRPRPPVPEACRRQRGHPRLDRNDPRPGVGA